MNAASNQPHVSVLLDEVIENLACGPGDIVIDGTFGGATLYGTLQNNTLSAGALSDLVPTDVQEKYLAYIDQMIAGTFMQ